MTNHFEGFEQESNAKIIITVRRNTELQSFYHGETEKGNKTFVGSITAAKNAPEWMTEGGRVFAGTLVTRNDEQAKTVMHAIINQYDSQILDNVTDPVVDVLIEIPCHTIGLPAFSVNPTDGEASANLIFQGWSFIAVRRGTSITTSAAATAELASQAADINDGRGVNAYHNSMARAAARRSNAADTTRIAIPATQVTTAL